MQQPQHGLSSPSCIGPRRRSFQWGLTLLILLLPWGHMGQTSLLRIDIPNLSLELFGATLRIEELYLLLFFSLALILFFLLVTLVTGRVWCGWACPQTTLSDLSEWFIGRLKLTTAINKKRGVWWRKCLFHLLLMMLAFLVASNLLWYFIEPRVYFSQLLSGDLHVVAVGALLITAVTVYVDMAFLRRTICRDFCPYGRFQTVLVDPGTLTLQLPDSEKSRCIKCGACVRACPMGIDIRNGYQIECINCGRCLDACRRVMAKRSEPGLIGYYFGANREGWRALLNPRTLLLTCGVATLVALLIFALQTRSAATLTVALSHQVSSRQLPDGTQASFFNAWVKNRTTRAESYQLEALSGRDGSRLQLKGPTGEILLQGGENRRIDFVLVTPAASPPLQVRFVLKQSEQILADSQAVITSSQSR